MKIDEVKSRFAMPITSPSFALGPYRFRSREYLIVDYETDMDALRRVVPEPLEVYKPVVRYEFIKMPDSDGFGSYDESGQVIPVTFHGKPGNYVHSMYLDDLSPIVGGREIWGFPKKYGQPEMRVDAVSKDCCIGMLKYGELEVARATMAYKWQRLDTEPLCRAMLETPNFLMKVIPDVDGTPKICQLVQYPLLDVTVKEAWTGPASLQLFSHCMAPVADLPVKGIVGAVHYISDLTLGLGEVVFDYLKEQG
ncbi:acetoacetate decarboxylase [Syntrophus buswellii]|jgi:acetoacetate decarboxylase|uniref:acetoacetate decarboxylase n=1 Tax=Syntrophus TaxID=43773 RepID=UPI0009C807FC|nr:MAG: putative acetoacetate decarboxylase [Syntrophus sp. PtaB.Bin138]